MYQSLVASLLLAILAVNAQAETFQVTRTDDPLPGACVPGDCSLREAMDAAAANDPFGGTDTIVLPAGTYTLIRGALSAVHQPLRVQGAGSGQTHITGSNVGDALFDVWNQGNLVLVGMSLDAIGDWVGALTTRAGALLALDDVVVRSGTVNVGAGSSATIRHGELRRGLSCYGELLVEDSAIFNLYQFAPQTGVPQTTLRRVLVDNALYPDAPLASTVAVHAGALTIEDSMLADSQIRIMGVASVDLRRVRYTSTIGPIRTTAAATVTIEDSLFENNTVRALYAAGGAQWNVSGSSFVNNLVDGNAGGAVLLEGNATLRIRNSTFSGNTFTVAAAANGARGAAIGYRNGTGAHLILTHVTLVAPTFMPTGVNGSAIGGIGNGVTLDISNSIVRGSCGLTSGVLSNNAGNIESPGNTCGLNAQGNSVNVATATLQLGALGYNGGPTPTYLPGTGSFAINRGSTPQCLPVDQRGYGRPGGVNCDVGAVEADAIDRLFANGFDG